MSLKMPNIITVYHRTKTPKRVLSIVKEGFVIGKKGLHGPGLYSSRSLIYDSNGMRAQYGEWILVYEVDISEYLILEENWLEIPIRKYLSSLKLRKDVRRGRAKFSKVSTIKAKVSTKVSNTVVDLRVVGKSKMSKAEHLKYIANSFKGAVYTGSGDGPCVVSYDPKTTKLLRVIDPLGFSHKLQNLVDLSSEIDNDTILDINKRYEFVKNFGTKNLWQVYSVSDERLLHNIIREKIDLFTRLTLIYFYKNNYHLKKESYNSNSNTYKRAVFIDQAFASLFIYKCFVRINFNNSHANDFVKWLLLIIIGRLSSKELVTFTSCFNKLSSNMRFTIEAKQVKLAEKKAYVYTDEEDEEDEDDDENYDDEETHLLVLKINDLTFSQEIYHNLDDDED